MPRASLSGHNKIATLKKIITKMKLTEEKRYCNFRLPLFLSEMRLNVLGMAITQPCEILINNNSLDQFFLHGTIRTQKIIEIMMLIRTTGESVKFIGSKYIQESLINTTLTRPDYFLFFARKSGKSVDQSEHSFISKQKQTTALHQGWQWALKIFAAWKILQLTTDHHAEWPLCKLWTLCFSVPDLVYPPPLK